MENQFEGVVINFHIMGTFNKKGIWKPYIYRLRDSERL